MRPIRVSGLLMPWAMIDSWFENNPESKNNEKSCQDLYIKIEKEYINSSNGLNWKGFKLDAKMKTAIRTYSKDRELKV